VKTSQNTTTCNTRTYVVDALLKKGQDHLLIARTRVPLLLSLSIPSVCLLRLSVLTLLRLPVLPLLRLSVLTLLRLSILAVLGLTVVSLLLLSIRRRRSSSVHPSGGRSRGLIPSGRRLSMCLSLRRRRSAEPSANVDVSFIGERWELL
jgi:hypothetical protein